MPKKDKKDALVFGGLEASSTTIIHNAASARSDQAATVHILPLNTWTNVTFKTELCAKIASDTTSLTVGFVAPLRFVIPDCLYNSSARITLLSLYSTILLGDATHPDPFDRLSTVLDSTGAVQVFAANSAFLPYDSSQYRPNWDKIWNDFPSIIGLSFEQCDVYGTLPTKLPNTLTTFSVHNNHMTGAIPVGLFSDYVSLTSTDPKQLVWTLTGNELNGTIPNDLIRNIPSYSQLYLSIDQNKLTGTIPANFMAITQSSTVYSIQLSFGNNLFVDTVPNDLWGLPTDLPLLNELYIDSSDLSLSGSVPSDWISQYSFSALTSFILIMPRCGLTGTIGVGILPQSASPITTISIRLGQNPFNSPIAPNFFQTAVSATPYSIQAGIFFNFTNCGITGSVSLPLAPMSAAPFLVLLMASNSLTTFNASANSTAYLMQLDLSNNRGLQGSIENLFSTSSSLLILDLSYTSMGGNMPDMSAMSTASLRTMHLDATAIEFCNDATNRSPWVSSALTDCSLLGTSASQCSSLYPSSCKTGPVPTAPSPPPCPGSPPTIEFVCVNGVWTFTGTVTAPTIVISPGTSEVIVNGNVTSGTVVLQGIGSSITVTGCFTNLSVVTIQLTPEDLKKLGSHSEIQLLRSSGNCSDYSTVSVATTVTRSSCRTVKVDKVAPTVGSLNGVLSVSSSRCNLWWIVVISVLGVLALGGVIVLLVTLHVRKQNSVSKAKAALKG